MVTLIGPLAVALGAGSLFGLAGIADVSRSKRVRVPVLILTTLAAVAPISTRSGMRASLEVTRKVPDQLKTMTTLEKQRTTFVLVASVITLGIVAFEVVAHILLH